MQESQPEGPCFRPKGPQYTEEDPRVGSPFGLKASGARNTTSTGAKQRDHGPCAVAYNHLRCKVPTPRRPPTSQTHPKPRTLRYPSPQPTRPRLRLHLPHRPPAPSSNANITTSPSLFLLCDLPQAPIACGAWYPRSPLPLPDCFRLSLCRSAVTPAPGPAPPPARCILQESRYLKPAFPLIAARLPARLLPVWYGQVAPGACDN